MAITATVAVIATHLGTLRMVTPLAPLEGRSPTHPRA